MKGKDEHLYIGDMDTLVVLQESVEVPDGIGGSTVEWVDRDEFYAEVNLESGEESKDITVNPTKTFEIKFRTRDFVIKEDDMRLILPPDTKVNIQVAKRPKYYSNTVIVTAIAG